MKPFNIIFKQYIQYYIYAVIVLIIVYFFTNSPFILGLIVGTIGSMLNTYTFEYYLMKAKRSDTLHISTGSVWRYLITLLACIIWLVFRSRMNIFGVVIGLMISYVLMVIRPWLHREK